MSPSDPKGIASWEATLPVKRLTEARGARPSDLSAAITNGNPNIAEATAAPTDTSMGALSVSERRV